VNAIAQGFFIGKQNRALLIDERAAEFTTRRERAISRTPFGRFREAQALDGAVLSLASGNASGLIPGVCIPVDCGFMVDYI
jgi:NAD(P)-dependent dehydrogenase (short-subunit alcohol dehydrogenase family)